jgi:protein-S-isoprenylcysteine O-methyltransferase Ste14
MTDTQSTALPASAVDHKAALLSLLGAILAIGIFRWFGLKDAGQCFLLIAVLIAVPHTWPIAKLKKMPAAEQRNAQVLRRVIVKILGLAAVYGLLALAYFAFQGFYQEFVAPLASVWSWLWLPVLAITPGYIYLTDLLMEQPEDGLYHWGRIVTGHFVGADWPTAQQFLLGWVVKGFFAPLMIGFALHDINWILSFDAARGLGNAADWYSAAYNFVFLIDVIFAATGYLCTFRLLDTHIRTTEPTMLGWVVCILCYPPFWPVFSNKFLHYEDGYYWGDWLASHPVLWTCWAVLIIGLLTVYSWATVMFGIRFSNLTNRGILTNGPYGWMKHPAYVSKNISWWLISVPFVSNGTGATILRDCVLLLCLNTIYFLRAKTEERNLSSDPAYAAYSAWIARNGIYARAVNGLRSIIGRALQV